MPHFVNGPDTVNQVMKNVIPAKARVAGREPESRNILKRLDSRVRENDCVTME